MVGRCKMEQKRIMYGGSNIVKSWTNGEIYRWGSNEKM